MNRTYLRSSATAAAALTIALSLAACGASNEDGSEGGSGSTASGTLNGAGSSAQEAAVAAWKKEFQTANPNVTVNYDPVGSGGGREQFLAGGVTFAGSDSYLTDEELAKVLGTFGVAATDELTRAQASELIDRLMAEAERRARAAAAGADPQTGEVPS